MIVLFLCNARRQKRSIVSLCEHFGVRSIRAKRANQNDFSQKGELTLPSHKLTLLCLRLEDRL